MDKSVENILGLDGRDFRKPLNKRNLLRDDVRNVIEEAILSNKLKPGDRVVETQWAKELSVSKAPVREAIRELETIGLLENEPFKGSFVKALTAKEIREAYKVRTALEVLSLMEVAKNITEPQLEKLREILEEMKEAAQRSDYEVYIERNIAFHEKIIETSDNRLLLRVWRQANITQWTRLITHLSGQSLDSLAVRHDAIYKALESHDPESAALAGIIHLEELIDEIEIQ